MPGPPPGTCWGCFKAGHLQQDCPELLEKYRQGLIHQDSDGKICLGPIGSNNPPIRLLRAYSKLFNILRAQDMAGWTSAEKAGLPVTGSSAPRVSHIHAITVESDTDCEVDDGDIDASVWDFSNTIWTSPSWMKKIPHFRGCVSPKTTSSVEYYESQRPTNQKTCKTFSQITTIWERKR